MGPNTRIDPLTLAVVRGGLEQATEEMDLTLKRTAFSPVISEGNDLANGCYDAETGEVTRHALTTEAYTDEQFEELLTEVGFADIRFFPSLVGVEVEEESQSANRVIVGKKRPNPAHPDNR